MVVARRIVGIDDDLHAEEVFQIEELFLLKPNDHRDVIDARLLELADLALNEDLTANFEHAFRAFVRKRRHARRESRRHDDGVAHLIRGKLVFAFCRKCSALNKAAIAKRLDNRVHRAEGHAALRGNRALRGRGRLLQSEHHIKFRAGKHRGSFRVICEKAQGSLEPRASIVNLELESGYGKCSAISSKGKDMNTNA